MNIIKIFEKFPTQESCIQHLEEIRWKDTPTCPYCKSTKTAQFGDRHRCYNCITSFSVTVGTIFHKTKIPLQKWFLAISLILNAKKSLSALQLSRDIQVNRNTAWRVAMQIRKAIREREQGTMLMGIVEMDETYVGGKPRKRNKRDDDIPNKRRRGTKKTPVVGAVERGGDVRAETTNKDKLKGKNLRSFVRRHIQTEEATLITDEYKEYIGMSKLIDHLKINHQKCYVNGMIHTNTIESFWSLLKRGMIGQFRHVSKRHLQRYVDEFCYRYNLRKQDQQLSFNQTINRALGV